MTSFDCKRTTMQGKHWTGSTILLVFVTMLLSIQCSPSPQMATEPTAQQEVSSSSSPPVPTLAAEVMRREADPVEVLVLGTGLYLVKVKNATGTELCFKVPTIDITQAGLGEKAANFTNNMAKLIDATFPHNKVSVLKG